MSVLLAAEVGPNGRVIGIERDERALAAARSVVEQSGVANVEVRAGDAAGTGIEAGSVDVAMMRHVLAHNGGHEQSIVDHLATLPRTGGAVYLVDVDLTAFRMIDATPTWTTSPRSTPASM
jgi:predicted O-methyltransferase YrrM